jgi:hypothetical protein
VLETTDDDPGDSIQRVFSFKEALGLDKGSVQWLGLLQSVNVLGSALVGVGVLEGLRELTVSNVWT